MKLLLKILICFLFLVFTGACSHSASLQLARNNFSNSKFTLDSRDYMGNRSIIGVRIPLSQNTMINLNIRSIADFIQPSDIEQDKKLYPEAVEVQPWAWCEISF